MDPTLPNPWVNPTHGQLCTRGITDLTMGSSRSLAPVTLASTEPLPRSSWPTGQTSSGPGQFEFSSLQIVKLWSTCVPFRRSLHVELTSWAYPATSINICLQALTEDISTPADVARSALETRIFYCFIGYISALTYYLLSVCTAVFSLASSRVYSTYLDFGEFPPPGFPVHLSFPRSLPSFPSLLELGPSPSLPSLRIRHLPLRLECLEERIRFPRKPGRSPAAERIWRFLGMNFYPFDCRLMRIISCVYCPLKEIFRDILICNQLSPPKKKLENTMWQQFGGGCKYGGSALPKRCLEWTMAPSFLDPLPFRPTLFYSHIYQKTSINTIILGNAFITKHSYLKLLI